FLPSQWMGLAYVDLNCDGFLDMFNTSIGDYLAPQLAGANTPPGLASSKWHFGAAGGTFVDPGVEGRAPMIGMPFGWGTGIADYDNDGFLDIIYYGNMDTGPWIDVTNPGVVLHNEGCSGHFTWDRASTAPSADVVSRSEVHGVALGDL